MKRITGIMLVVSIILCLAACGPSNVPTDEEVNTAYQRAVEAFEWFHLTTMPIDDNSRIDYNDNYYYKVKHDSIQSLSDLETYLHSLFSDDIVASLLDEGDYVEIDGAIYTALRERGSNIHAGNEYHKIIHESNKKITYEVTVDLFGDDLETVVDKEIYTFAYELSEDKWVFTNFELVR